MYLTAFRIFVQKYMGLILPNISASVLIWQAALIKRKVKLDQLTDINMLLMVKKSYNEVDYTIIFINM